MSDNQPKEKDSKEPVGEKSAAEDARKKPVHPRKKHKSRGNHAALIIVVLTGLLLAGGWSAYDYLDKYNRQLKQLATSQDVLRQRNQQLQEELDSKLSIIKQQQDDLGRNIESLREKNSYLRKDWLLLEAEYLIQLANQRLLFERDINTAIAALDAADARLRDSGDPGLVKVRKIISESIQSLKQVPQSDLPGMSLTLSTINKDIEKLPLATPDPKSRQHAIEDIHAESPDVKSWKELPAAMWRDLKNLIVIRDHEKPVQPLLSPEQRFFLLENLRLQTEQARLAMLSGQTEVFDERMATAISWIEQHFDQESQITKTTLEALRQLAATNIKPELPDISATFQAIQAYRIGEAVTPAPAKTKTEAVQPDSKQQDKE